MAIDIHTETIVILTEGTVILPRIDGNGSLSRRISAGGET